MDLKEIKYLVEGLSTTLSAMYEELNETLVAKGKKRLGQEDAGDSPQISELIRRTRERRTLVEILASGKGSEEELIQAIGGEVKKILSSAGIVTRSDLARVERRMDEIEKALEDRGN